MATATAEPAPVTNGTAPSPSPIAEAKPAENGDTITSSGVKRKREESAQSDAEAGANNDTPVKINGESAPSLQEVLRDVLKVLRKHDTTPSILSHSLSKDSDETSTSGERSAKRAKLNDTPTIASRIDNGDYSNFNDLLEDVDAVIDDLLAQVREKEIDLPQTQYGRPSTLTAEETRLWSGTTKFKKLLSSVVQAEKERQKLVSGGKKLLKKNEEDTIQVAVKEEDDAYAEAKPVLTLYANALAPKQLFSSFQKPAKDDGSIPPLRESGLPSFIGTTEIAPAPADVKKKGLTIGEVYGSSSEKYKLQPPKPSKSKLIATGNTVDFVRLDTSVRPNRRNSYNYFTDKLAVGQWLGYGGVDTPTEPTSPQAKRKQRDRALSSGEAFLPPSDAEKEALRRARNDALFRKCYGSFAPSYDDSIAVVPKDVRNDIWMTKVTERIAQKDIVVDPALLDPPSEPTAEEKALEMKELEQFVDTFDPALLEWDAEERKKEKEMDDILQEVTELIETLSSFQRIRHSTLNTSARTTVGQNDSAKDLIGTPTEPSAAEKEIYKTLKLQLAVLVNQLPPYAVARLNGDQLEELNIKTSIVVETEDARGVMAEDEATRAAKMQAYAAAAGSQSQVGRTPSTNSYANYPASASQYNRTPAQQQPLRPSTSNYYTPGSQSQARPAPIAYNRSSSGLQNSYTNNFTPQTAARTSYQQSYNSNATPRPNNYSQQSSQYYQNTTANKSSYNQNYPHQGTPQQQRPSYQQNTPAASYQQRPSSSTAPMYGGYAGQQSPQARTNSPQVPPSSQYNQQRPQGYSTPVGGPTNPNYYRPPSSAANNNYTQPRMAPSASMTPSRQGSGTPQPAQNYGQTNGTTPAPQMVGQGSS